MIHRHEQAGVVQFEMSAPGARSIRVAERVFIAVQEMQGARDLGSWHAAVAARDPGISEAQLASLLRRLVEYQLVVTRAPAAQPLPSPSSSVESGAPPERDFDHTVIVTAPTPEPVPAPVAASSASSTGASSGSGRPRARTDLHMERGTTKGIVNVTDPRSGRTFQIYDFEARLLTKVDGSKTLDELCEVCASTGHPITAAQLTTFLREMNGYGFLADTGGVDVGKRRPLGAPLKKSDPEREVPQSEWDEEERRLFQGGLGLFRQGQLDAAEGYFLALVETNPKNAEAISMLQIVRDAKAGRVTGPVLLQDDEEVEGSLHDLAEAAPDEGEADAEGGDDEERDPAQASAVWDEAEEQVMADPAVAERRRRRRLRLALKILAVPAALVVLGVVVPYPLQLTYPCQVEPLQRDVLRAPRPGVIEAVLVEEGQQVKAGDILAHLANADFRTAVVKSEAQLERAKAELELLRAGSRQEEVDRARARVNGLAREVGVASTRVSRLRSLVKKGVAPRGQLEEAQQQLVALQGDLSQARADLNLAQAGSRPDEIRRKEAEIRGFEAQLALDKEVFESTVMRATLSGVVTTRRPKELIGTSVRPGDAVLEVATLSRMRAEILVDERDFDVLAPELPVELKVASHPTEVFAGKVLRIAPKIEATEAGNVARVEAELENREGLLVPNMTGYAQISAGKKPIGYLVVRRLLRWVRVRFLI